MRISDWSSDVCSSDLPGVWNSWKRQLLTELFDAAEEVLRLGHKQKGRETRIAAKKDAAQAILGRDDKGIAKLIRPLPESYWNAEPVEVHAANHSHIWEACETQVTHDALPREDTGEPPAMGRARQR